MTINTKSLMQKSLLSATAMVLLMTGTAQADVIHKLKNNNVFMQNNFFSIGHNTGGALGTMDNAAKSMGVEVDPKNSNLGWVVDLDGFGKGAPALRDIVMQASNTEGFMLAYKAKGVQKTPQSRPMRGYTQVPMISVKDISTDKVASADWIGMTADKLQVQQVMSMGENDKFVRINVTLTNVSDETLTDLRYVRILEPDQGADEENTEATLATIQTIMRQGNGEALVQATTIDKKLPFFYYAKDPRAVASFVNIAAFFVGPLAYPELLDKPLPVGATHKGQNTSGMAFKIGDLQPGKQAYLTLYMGINDSLDAAMKEIAAGAGNPDPKPENAAPVATADRLELAFGQTAAINLLANDKDADGDKLTIKLLAAPKNAKAVLGADGIVKITPNDGFSGADSLTYEISDGKATAQAQLAIIVAEKPNTAPVAVADKIAIDNGGTATLNLLANDSDVDGDKLRASMVTAPKNVKAILRSDGTVELAAPAGFAGSDVLVYEASDGEARAQARLDITVKEKLNTAPVAVGDSIKLAFGAGGSINLLANDRDADGDKLTIKLLAAPRNAKAVIGADGMATITPNAGFSGLDRLTYEISDGKAVAQADLAITVGEKPNAAPVAMDDAIALDQDKVASGNLLANDRDDDGDKLTVRLLGNMANIGIELRDDGSFAVKPKAGWSGVESLNYAISDGKAEAQAKLTVTVRKVEAPVPPPAPKSNIVAVAKNAIVSGESGDAVASAFLLDTSAGSLGKPVINNLGGKDVLLLTAKLRDGDGDGIINFKAKGFNLTDAKGKSKGGLTKLTDIQGMPVTSLRMLGEVSNNGVTYYVYGELDSTAGVGAVKF